MTSVRNLPASHPNDELSEKEGSSIDKVGESALDTRVSRSLLMNVQIDCSLYRHAEVIDQVKRASSNGHSVEGDGQVHNSSTQSC